MTSAELAQAGRALHGRGWQTRLAEALGVDGSTVRRWVSGAIPVPGPVAAAVRCFVREADARAPRDAGGLQPSGMGAPITVTKEELAAIYRDYIACLNRRDLQKLGGFVGDEVWHNGRQIGLSGYRAMLVRDLHDIPDLHFDIQLLIADPPHIASRLAFDCTPRGRFLGLEVNGRKVSFAENVFYEFREQKIVQVWSVIDKAAIEAQL